MTATRHLCHADGRESRINLASAGRYAVALGGRIIQGATVAAVQAAARPLGWYPCEEGAGALPTPESLGLSYVAECPEFASHGFDGPDGRALYTRHGQGFGRPVFKWKAPRWVRAVPMYRVTGIPS